MDANQQRQIDQELKQRFGFVPKFFTALPDAARLQQWAVMRDFGLGTSVLPSKTKELIGLALAAHIKCRYCIYFHTKAAKAFGATDEELREAAFQGGYTAQFSSSLTGMMVDLDEFKGEVDRAVAFMGQQQGGKQPESQPTPSKH